MKTAICRVCLFLFLFFLIIISKNISRPVLEHAGCTVHHMGKGGADEPPSEIFLVGWAGGAGGLSGCNLGMEWRALVRDGERPNCIF